MVFMGKELGDLSGPVAMGNCPHEVAGAIEALVGFGAPFDGTGFEPLGAVGYFITGDHLQQFQEEVVCFFFERAWAIAKLNCRTESTEPLKLSRSSVTWLM